MTSSKAELLVDGLRFPESVRWHDEQLWFCNWLAAELVVVDPGTAETRVIAGSPVPIPFAIDWLPDGRMLVTSGRQVLAGNGTGALVPYADLDAVVPAGVLNEIVVGPDGHAFVNGSGYDMMAGEAPVPGAIFAVTEDGSAVQVADDIHFGNGMAITPDGETLLVAESHAARITAFRIIADGTLADRRVWAALGVGAAPDGISLGADGSVWYADVPNERCVRVREHGDVLDVVEADRGCFDCALGGLDGGTLFIAAAIWAGGAGMRSPDATGQILRASTR